MPARGLDSIPGGRYGKRLPCVKREGKKAARTSQFTRVTALRSLAFAGGTALASKCRQEAGTRCHRCLISAKAVARSRY